MRIPAASSSRKRCNGYVAYPFQNQKVNSHPGNCSATSVELTNLMQASVFQHRAHFDVLLLATVLCHVTRPLCHSSRPRAMNSGTNGIKLRVIQREASLPKRKGVISLIDHSSLLGCSLPPRKREMDSKSDQDASCQPGDEFCRSRATFQPASQKTRQQGNTGIDC